MVLIKYLELTKGPNFSKSRSGLESVVNATLAYHRQPVDMHIARATNKISAWNEIVETESFLHLAGHGQSQGVIGGLVFRQMKVQDFASYMGMHEMRIDLNGILIDACSTFSREWLEQISQSIPKGKSTVVIGTRSDVPFENAELFAQVFYMELFKAPYPKGDEKRMIAIEKAVVVAQRAEAWRFGRPSYFKMKRVVGK